MSKIEVTQANPKSQMSSKRTFRTLRINFWIFLKILNRVKQNLLSLILILIFIPKMIILKVTIKVDQGTSTFLILRLLEVKNCLIDVCTK